MYKLGNIIRERAREVRQERIATAEEVLENLTQYARGEKPAKPSDIIKANELLGKRYAIFVDKTENTNDTDINVNINVVK